MRWIRGLAVLGLLIGVAVGPSPATAQEEPFPLDVAPIWAVVYGSQFCCQATAEDQIIGGQSWEDGDEIDLFVNGEYVATTIAEPNDEGSATPVFDVNALGIVLHAGDEVRLVRTDGGRTEVHVVTDLIVRFADVVEDTVSGVAEPGSEVWVFVPNTFASRVETVDSDGWWSADFSVPGDQPGEETTFDLEALTIFGAAQFDADGNATLWLSAPAAYAPIIAIVDGYDILGGPSPQAVGGQGWTVGDVVDLFIDGSYVATTIAEPNGEGSASPFYDVNALGITIVPGDEITLVRQSDGRTETHVVTELGSVSVNATTDTVAGLAAPGSSVVVAVAAERGAVLRTVTADIDGEWLADFSQPGPLGEPSVDLPPGAVVLVQQFDGDGNATAIWASASPTEVDQCKRDGWEDFGVFENQGQCVASVVAAGFQEIEMELNTFAYVDFGFGEVDYHAIGTVPAKVRLDGTAVILVYFVDGLRYVKADPGEPGPEFFDLTGGTYRASGRVDATDPAKGFGKFQWHVELLTDQGVEYRSTGLILDRNGTEDRDVWVWTGPIIEP